jgi:hypothetical protein
LISDALHLQLDDGSLVGLRHPGEDCDCKRHGLRLRDASERGRLFAREYFLCRSCGHMSARTTAAPRWTRRRDLGEPISWRAYAWMLGVAAVWSIIALYFHWWLEAVCLSAGLVLGPPWERWKFDRARRRSGVPEYPLTDAPGRTTIPPPVDARCCDRPDLADTLRVRDGEIPCPKCKRGKLNYHDHGVA